MTTLYTFIATTVLSEKGVERGIPYSLPDVTIPRSLKLLYGLVKAHPQYLVAFLLIAAIGIIVGIAIAMAKGREKRLRRSALFKPVARLGPADVGIENYLGKECYVRRKSDEALASLLEGGAPAILIIGRPGSGKTRTVFEALSSMAASLPAAPPIPALERSEWAYIIPSKGKEDLYILVPRPRLTSLKELAIPGLSSKKIVLFLDDLHRYVKKLDVVELLRQLEVKAAGTVLIATCSPDKLQFLEKETPELLRLFRPKNRISLRDLSPAEQTSLASALGHGEMATMANVTPASLVLNLAEMKERYKNSGDARLIIHSLLLLHKAFIFACGEPLARKVCERVFNKTFSRSQWKGAIKGLVTMGFISSGKAIPSKDGTLEIYEGYLEEGLVDDYSPSEGDMNALQEVLLKSRDWEGLFSIGVYYSTEGQWEKSLQALEKAVEMNPHSTEIRYFLGQAYMQSGMTERALEAYRAVARADKRNPRAYYALGILYN
ncbi:MAG: tetratricopeptide repeat protein, partial [Candidatus Brocadiales bacterium]